MPGGRYLNLDEGFTRCVKGQLVMDSGGSYFVEHRDQNSMDPLHRIRCYVLPRVMTLSFYRSSGVMGDGAATESYDFPAGSRIFKHRSGKYEVFHENQKWSVVVRSVKGVFVRGNVHGFVSPDSRPIAQPKGFTPGKRPRAPGHL